MSLSRYLAAKLRHPEPSDPTGFQPIPYRTPTRCDHVAQVCDVCLETWSIDWIFYLSRTATGREVLQKISPSTAHRLLTGDPEIERARMRAQDTAPVTKTTRPSPVEAPMPGSVAETPQRVAAPRRRRPRGPAKMTSRGLWRLPKGELLRQILALLTAHPDQDWSVNQIARQLGGRSTGAVGAALRKAADRGEIQQISRSPERFQAITPTPAASQSATDSDAGHVAPPEAGAGGVAAAPGRPSEGPPTSAACPVPIEAPAPSPVDDAPSADAPAADEATSTGRTSVWEYAAQEHSRWNGTGLAVPGPREEMSFKRIRWWQYIDNKAVEVTR